MKKLLVLLTVVFIAILAGCSKDEQYVKPDMPVLKSNPVPFEGYFEGFAFNGGPASCGSPYTPKYFDGEGVASHCGKSTLHCEYCVYTVLVPPFTPPFLGTIINGTGEITAANGDKLTSTLTGTYTIDYVPNVGWVNTIIINDGVITGGTGRFEGASGTYTGGGTQDCGNGPMPVGNNVASAFWFEGMIDY